jgi:hypothetical protein
MNRREAGRTVGIDVRISDCKDGPDEEKGVAGSHEQPR